jgi:hypothetical protein
MLVRRPSAEPSLLYQKLKGGGRIATSQINGLANHRLGRSSNFPPRLCRFVIAYRLLDLGLLFKPSDRFRSQRLNVLGGGPPDLIVIRHT